MARQMIQYYLPYYTVTFLMKYRAQQKQNLVKNITDHVVPTQDQRQQHTVKEIHPEHKPQNVFEVIYKAIIATTKSAAYRGKVSNPFSFLLSPSRSPFLPHI